MMPFPDAQRAILDACRPLRSEAVVLADAAGRILARDIISSEDLVPFARSAMDGYAVSSLDLTELPLSLPLSGSVFAAPGTRMHPRGTATAIATGAAIPVGADCVIPIEDVGIRDGAIVVSQPVSPGTCVFPPGDDARRGSLLLARETLLTPACLGLLAAAGTTRVDVYRRPTVAIVCGGDELVDIDMTPGYGQIRDSNGIMLATSLIAMGADVIAPIRLKDNARIVRDALSHALASADLVVTTGGASVGERDFVKSACTELGVTFFFRTVGLRPAKPTAFGRRGEAFVAVLPGNPAAAFVALHEFVAPAVRALRGDARPLMPRIGATLDGSIHAKPERHFAAFAALRSEPDGLHASPLENQCSSLTRTAVDAAGFIIVPPGSQPYASGDRVEVDVFDWSRLCVSQGVTLKRARAIA